MANLGYFNHKIVLSDTIQTYTVENDEDENTVRLSNVYFYATALPLDSNQVEFRNFQIDEHRNTATTDSYIPNNSVLHQKTEFDNLNNTRLPYHMVIYMPERTVVDIDRIVSFVNYQLDSLKRVNFNFSRQNELSKFIQDEMSDIRLNQPLNSTRYQFRQNTPLFSETTVDPISYEEFTTHSIVSHTTKDLLERVIPFAWQREYVDLNQGESLEERFQVDLEFTKDRITEVTNVVKSDQTDPFSEVLLYKDDVPVSIVAPSKKYYSSYDRRYPAFTPKNRITLETNIGLVGITIVPS